MKKSCLLLCLSFLAIIHAHGQGYFYESGQSGFNLAANLASSEGSTLFGVTPGYTSNGKLSFGITLGLTENNDYDLSSTLIGPYIDYLVVKQGENEVPVNVSLASAFQYNIYKEIDDLTANTISFHCEISHIINSTQHFKIIPIGSVSWQRSKLSLSGYGEENFSLLGFALGGSLVIDRFFITPALSIAEGDSAFSIDLGMIFPQ